MIPWWVKLYAKLIFARLPFSYRIWTRLPIFRHGSMKDSAYAANVFERHLPNAPPTVRDACMEIGPGDSLFTAINSRAGGFERTYLVDAGDFASRDLGALKEFALARRLDPDRVAGWTSVDHMLSDLGATYLTDGLNSLRQLPEACVSFIFSQAVLEHIRKREYAEFIAETFRLLTPGGICSHRIDLQDHLQAGLHNLRFSSRVWESDFFAQSGFYTNRLSVDDHLKAFRDAGFRIITLKADHFAEIPIRRSKLAPEFRALTDNQLLVKGFDLVVGKD